MPKRPTKPTADLKCRVCKVKLVESNRSKSGRGPLRELSCPKCRVSFFIQRGDASTESGGRG